MNTFPPPGNNNVVRPPTLLSVMVEDGEVIEWIWTHFADGSSAVTGYRILPQFPGILGSK